MLDKYIAMMLRLFLSVLALSIACELWGQHEQVPQYTYEEYQEWLYPQKKYPNRDALWKERRERNHKYKTEGGYFRDVGDWFLSNGGHWIGEFKGKVFEFWVQRSIDQYFNYPVYKDYLVLEYQIFDMNNKSVAYTSGLRKVKGLGYLSKTESYRFFYRGPQPGQAGRLEIRRQGKEHLVLTYRVGDLLGAGDPDVPQEFPNYPQDSVILRRISYEERPPQFGEKRLRGERGSSAGVMYRTDRVLHQLLMASARSGNKYFRLHDPKLLRLLEVYYQASDHQQVRVPWRNYYCEQLQRSDNLKGDRVELTIYNLQASLDRGRSTSLDIAKYLEALTYVYLSYQGYASDYTLFPVSRNSDEQSMSAVREAFAKRQGWTLARLEAVYQQEMGKLLDALYGLEEYPDKPLVLELLKQGDFPLGLCPQEVAAPTLESLRLGILP